MSLNKQFVELLEQLYTIKSKDGNFFRAKAYEKAKDAIIKFNKPITSIDDVKQIPNVGKSIIQKFEEFLKNGSLSIIEKAKNNPVYILQDVYGIGPKKANELVKVNKITTIQQLRKQQNTVLNDVQRKGLKYYEDILKRIPRSEIVIYQNAINSAFQQIANSREQFMIVGSYRRGAQTSGDIDIIIESSVPTYKGLIQCLVDQNIIIEILSFGNKKCLCVAKLKGMPARRLDFMVTPSDEWAFALCYFTGGKEFNTLMRERARQLGYTMNEHCFSKLVNGSKTDKLNKKFTTEKDVFDFLNVEYVEPHMRNSVNFKIIETKPKKKRKTRKIVPIRIHINRFIKDYEYIVELNEDQLVEIIRLANDGYYNNNKSIMTDEKYDYIIDYIKEVYPDNDVVNEGHTLVKVDDDRKITLPYEMWSMDKVKKEKDVSRKIKSYKGDRILSVKLDGCSLGYSTEKGGLMLYTRGNGIVGQNVTHLSKYLNLPVYPGISVRGEIMIDKHVFDQKYSKKFANPRNFVSGILNAKTINPNVVKDLTFIAYELVEPQRNPEDQLLFLKNIGFNVVPHVKVENIHKLKNPFKFLKDQLLSWKNSYNFEMDGIIVTRNHEYERISGNPKHAWAFKIITQDQIAQTVVEEMIWSPSKDGRLKPKIKVKPVNVSGTTITYVTVHNEVWRRDNGIDVGAVIEIIRSGDVIPKVHKVLTPVEPKPPPSHFKVVLKGVDYVLIDLKDNMVVRMKAIHAFFEKIGAIGLGRGNVQRIMNAGFDTMSKILAMKYEDFLEVDGFKEKMATKVYNGIRTAIENIDLPSFMAATNIFGRGLGAKKMKIIFDNLPDVLDEKYNETIYENSSVGPKGNTARYNIIVNMPGFSHKSASMFVDYLDKFKEFMEKSNLTHLYNQKTAEINEDNPFYGKKIVFTGCRNKELEKYLQENGANLTTSISKNTDILVYKNKSGRKYEKARALGITTHQFDTFKAWVMDG